MGQRPTKIAKRKLGGGNLTQHVRRRKRARFNGYAREQNYVTKHGFIRGGQETILHVEQVERHGCHATICIGGPSLLESQTKIGEARRDAAKSRAWYADHASEMVDTQTFSGIKVGMSRGQYGNDAVFAAKYSCNFENIERLKHRVQDLINMQDEQMGGATMALAIITWQDATPVLTTGVLGKNPIIVYEQGKPFMGVLDVQEYSRANRYLRANKPGPEFDANFTDLNNVEGDTKAHHEIYDQTLDTKQAIGDKYFDVSHVVTWQTKALPDHATLVLANQSWKPDTGFWYSFQSKDQLDTLVSMKQEYTTHEDFASNFQIAKTCIFVAGDELTIGEAVVCGVFSAHNGRNVAKYMVDNLDACVATDGAFPLVAHDDYTKVRAEEVFTEDVEPREIQPESCSVEVVPKEKYQAVLDQLLGNMAKAQAMQEDLTAKVDQSINRMKLNLPHDYVFLKEHMFRESERLSSNVRVQDTQAFIEIAYSMIKSLSNKLGRPMPKTEEDDFWDTIAVCRNLETNQLRSIAFYGMDSKRLYIAFLITHVDNIRGSSTRKTGASSEIMKFCLQQAKDDNIPLVLKPIPNAKSYYVKQGFVDAPHFKQGPSASKDVYMTYTPR
jgi:hypothetical protein